MYSYATAGCPLTGACIIQPERPPPTADVVDDQIDLITGNPLGDGEFGNEDSIDDNEEGDEGANNPISPPQPLFDTRPLIPSGDVSDPVSGTGNPALLGSDSDCEEGEDGRRDDRGDEQVLAAAESEAELRRDERPEDLQRPRRRAQCVRPAATGV